MTAMRALRFFTIAVAFAMLAPSVAAAAPVAITNAGFEALYTAGNLPAQYAGDVPAGAFPTGAPPAGWQDHRESGTPLADEFIGVLNPGTSADYAGAPAGITPCFPAGAPEGDNVALLFTGSASGGQEYGIEQTLAATIQPDTVYTLTVEVGNIQSCGGLVPPYDSQFVIDGFPSYRVQLLAGGVVLAEDAGSLAPAEGSFETTSFQLTTGSSPAQQGVPITIRLVNRNLDLVPAIGNREVDFDDVRLDASPVAAVPVGSAGVGLALALGAGAVWRLARSSAT